MSAGQQFIKEKGYSNKTQVKLRSTVGQYYCFLLKIKPKLMALKSFSPLQIQVLPAGAETTLFKQYFADWRDKDETTGPSKAYTIGSIAKIPQVPFDASTLHSNKAMAAQHGMVDDGKGKVQVC